MSNVVHPGPSSHDGPSPKFTGGNHPTGHEVSPGTRRDAFDPAKTGGLANCGSVKGYTKLDDSPIGGEKPYDNLTKGPREYKGIDPDVDQDGDYTGGTGTYRETD